MIEESEEESISLSADTLQALQEFRSAEEAENERFAALQAKAQARFGGLSASNDESLGAAQGPDIDMFKEDWQLSQFWYSSATADTLAEELLSDSDSRNPPRIGVLCAPSVYPKLIARHAADAWLFEYDTRFEVLAHDHFVKYDYNNPFQLPLELKGTFDRLIIDPPFLSDECEVKAATTARWLGKADAKFIVCSGAKMRDLLLRLYKARETNFQVEHSNGRLSNDFMCLLNYTSKNPNFAFLRTEGIAQEYTTTSTAA